MFETTLSSELELPMVVAEVSIEKSSEVLQLFKAVFDIDISEPWWQWKHKEGGGYWEGRQLLGHCGIFQDAYSALGNLT